MHTLMCIKQEGFNYVQSKITNSMKTHCKVKVEGRGEVVTIIFEQLL